MLNKLLLRLMVQNMIAKLGVMWETVCVIMKKL